MKRIKDVIRKREGLYTTGAPGIKGQMEIQHMVRSAQENRYRETEEKLAWLHDTFFA